MNRWLIVEMPIGRVTKNGRNVCPLFKGSLNELAHVTSSFCILLYHCHPLRDFHCMKRFINSVIAFNSKIADYRSVMSSFYAVAKGRRTGIFSTWDETKASVTGFKGSIHKKFKTVTEAQQFLRENSDSNDSSPVVHTSQPLSSNATVINGLKPEVVDIPEGYFAVIRGRMPGIYSQMSDVMQQTKGYESAYFESFKTYREAQSFLQNRNQPTVKSEDVSTHTALNSVKLEPPEPSLPYSTIQSTDTNTDQMIHLPETEPLKHVEVYTDGACSNNGQRGSTAGIGVYWGPNDIRNVSEPLSGRPTNNRAEIHAVIRAVNDAKRYGYKSITIKTDSQFLIDSMTKWIKGWKKNGWLLSTGGPVKNREDFEELDQASQGILVEYKHVTAHNGIEGNEEADRLARDGISLAGGQRSASTPRHHNIDYRKLGAGRGRSKSRGFNKRFLRKKC